MTTTLEEFADLVRARVAAETPAHLQQAVRMQDDGPHPDDCVYRADVDAILREVLEEVS